MPPSTKHRALLIALPVAAVVAAIAAWYWRPASSADAAPIAGMVRTTEIHIAPEVSGHLARFLAQPGQAVTRGQPVAVLTNPELWAAVDAAKAVVDKARSDRDRVYAGVRAEQVLELQRDIDKAVAVHDQAVLDLGRKTVLTARSDTSVQDLDIAKAAEAHAAADIVVAEARYAEAQRGPTAEERALADATVAAAEAARDVVEARAAKMLLRSPADGVVGILAAEPGEAVIPGEPVLTILPSNGIWFGFSLREDALHDLTIGSKLAVRAAGTAAPIAAKVTEMRNWGEFATWRAARAVGDHDLNTFFVRLDPQSAGVELAPGQTVWLRQADEGK